jgi:hypothetical protein
MDNVENPFAGFAVTKVFEPAPKRRSDCLYLPRPDGEGDVEIEVTKIKFLKLETPDGQGFGQNQVK